MIINESTRLHPRTGLPLIPVGIRKDGRPIWPILGAEDGGKGSGDAGGKDGGAEASADDAGGKESRTGASGSGTGGQPDLGFPANTPIADMTVDQQAAYWKHQARKHEGRANDRADYDAVRSERDRLKAEHSTEQEKAVEKARNEGREQGIKESAPRLVAAEIRGRAAGRLGEEQLAEVLAGINPTYYLTDKGEVDTDKVTRFVASLAPGKEGTSGPPDFGQGPRGGAPKPSVQAGRDLYQASRPKQKTT